jgi:hypothetical protein
MAVLRRAEAPQAPHKLGLVYSSLGQVARE